MTEVRIDPKKNRFFLIYLSSISVVGIALIAATVMWEWGLCGFLGGGLLLVSGIGGMAGMAMTGGMGLVTCPSCGHATSVQHISMHRFVECEGCGVWLEGSTEMQLVPADRVADHAAFTCALPESVQWPTHPDGSLVCPTCGGVATRMVTIEGTSAVGDVAGMVAPVSVQKVHRLEVPACAAHDDGVALLVLEELKLGFKAYGYLRAFRATNG